MTHKTIKLSTPDLIGMTDEDSVKSQYGVFEAKGYQVFSTKTMKKATEQVQQIKMINNVVPLKKIVAYTRLSPIGNTIRTKDPEGGIFDIEFDTQLALLWQYLPVVDLFREMRTENKLEFKDGFCILNHSFIEGSESMKISKDLYDVLAEYHGNLDKTASEKWSRNRISRVFERNLFNVIIE